MSVVTDILGLTNTVQCDSTLSSATNEMKIIYNEEPPYQRITFTNGYCYRWSQVFLDKCMETLSTDNMSMMNEYEKKIWNGYILWVDFNINNPDWLLENSAVGCTVPDINGDSFIVLANGTITTTLCGEPITYTDKQDIYKSLDNVLLAMANGTAYNECGKEEVILFDVML